MAKDFSFPFYVNNWIGGTSYLSFEQKGAYLELLLLQFNHGKFKETQVKQVLNISYSNVWPEIQHKFVSDGTFYWNEKMEEVKEERRLFVESRRNNRLGKTSLTSVKHKKKTRKTYDKHMEGESKGEDINVFEDFRLLYGGTKLGLETEFDNFKKKHKDWKLILPTLKDAIQREIEWRKKPKAFTPEWKMLSTWINQRQWEQIFPEINGSPTVKSNAAIEQYNNRTDLPK